jgi:hypothetical protein
LAYRIWNEESLRAALHTALDTGRAVIPLTTIRDARKFRNAIYNFRRRTNLGPKLSIQVVDSTVIITDPPKLHPALIILTGSENP